MKTKKQMRKLFPIPIIETGSSKLKCVIGSVPLFNTQSESETYVSSMHSQYIQNVLKRNESYETTFGVYEDEKTVLLKQGVQVLKITRYTYLQMAENTKGTQGLWELLAKSKPD